MFEMFSSSILKIDKKEFKKIFGNTKNRYYTGCKMDITELKNDNKLQEFLFNEGVDLVDEIIEPLENCVYTNITIEAV